MNTAKLHKKERKAKNIFPFHSFFRNFGFAEVGWHSGKCKFICFSSRSKKALWLRLSCFALGKNSFAFPLVPKRHFGCA